MGGWFLEETSGSAGRRGMTVPSALFEKLVKTRSLPTPSATALRVLELADQPNCSLVEVADVVSADPAISARILKFANSAQLAGGGPEVTTIRHAVMRLGLRAVKVTALSFSLVTDRDQAKCPGFDHNMFWAHSLATATAARAIIDRTAPTSGDEAFIAGLLSRLGKLVFAVGCPTEYQAVLQPAGSVLKTTIENERAILGTDHVELGGSLMKLWKLPRVLAQAVTHQLDIEAIGEDSTVKCLAAAIALSHRIADCLIGVDENIAGLLGPTAPGLAIPQTEPELLTWMEQLSASFREAADTLAISLDDVPEVFEMQSRAADLIAELSMTAEADVQTIQAQKRELEQKATTDSLTGLHNRAAFDRQLNIEIERSARYKRPMTLLMLDVDKFKSVNDTHGHLGGDVILQNVARVMREVVRETDFVARYGGEEFAVIAPETDLRQAAFLAERIRKAIEAASCAHDGKQLTVTASLGVASIIDPAKPAIPKILIENADKALYEAKRTGRNRCCFAKYVAVPVVEPAAVC